MNTKEMKRFEQLVKELESMTRDWRAAKLEILDLKQKLNGTPVKRTLREMRTDQSEVSPW